MNSRERKGIVQSGASCTWRGGAWGSYTYALLAVLLVTGGGRGAPLDPAVLEALTPGRLPELAALLKADPRQVRARDQRGWTLAQHATLTGNRDAVRLLLGLGAEADVFVVAGTGLTETLRELLRANPALARARLPGSGLTPLHFALGNGHHDAARLLLERGADVNAADEGDFGSTPLHTAAGDRRLAELLLAHGANVNARDKALRTPLFLASPEVMALLLAHGADVNAQDYLSLTPLIEAARGGR